jgi:hypothetical protein
VAGLYWYLAPTVDEPIKEMAESEIEWVDPSAVVGDVLTSVDTGSELVLEIIPGEKPVQVGDKVRVGGKGIPDSKEAVVSDVSQGTGPLGGDEVTVPVDAGPVDPGAGAVFVVHPSVQAGDVIRISNVDGDGLLQPGDFPIQSGDYVVFDGDGWSAWSRVEPPSAGAHPATDTGSGLVPHLPGFYGYFIRLMAHRTTPSEDVLVGCHRPPNPMPTDWSSLTLQQAKDHYEAVMGYPPSDQVVY